MSAHPLAAQASAVIQNSTRQRVVRMRAQAAALVREAEELERALNILSASAAAPGLPAAAELPKVTPATPSG